MIDTDAIGQEAMELANDLAEILEGKNTVAAYCAIGMALGYMEAQGKHPDRVKMFELISRGMDEEIERQSRHWTGIA